MKRFRLLFLILFVAAVAGCSGTGGNRQCAVYVSPNPNPYNPIPVVALYYREGAKGGEEVAGEDVDGRGI